MEECVAVSRKFAALLASALDVPVFLYGSAARAPYRTTMPQIRAGEYEGLEEKVRKGDTTWYSGICIFCLVS